MYLLFSLNFKTLHHYFITLTTLTFECKSNKGSFLETYLTAKLCSFLCNYKINHNITLHFKLDNDTALAWHHSAIYWAKILVLQLTLARMFLCCIYNKNTFHKNTKNKNSVSFNKLTSFN